MKDINGQQIKKGDDVLIIEGKNKVPATVTGLNETKIKLSLNEGTIVVGQKKIKLQKLTAVSVADNAGLSSDDLLREIFTTTKTTSCPSDVNPDLGLDTMRAFGIGFHNNSMKLDENQTKYNTYGKIYRLLKEAFDVAVKDDNLHGVAKNISKIANHLTQKMDK